MSIRIEIADDSRVEVKAGTSKKTGKDYSIAEQSAYAHVLDEFGKPGRYPVACRVRLEDPDKPYKLGFYSIDPRSFFVGDYGALGIGKLRLVPIASATPKAA